MDTKQEYGPNERPALVVTEKGRNEAAKRGASYRAYILTEQGKRWLAAQEEKAK